MKKNTNKTPKNILKRILIATTLATLLVTIPPTTYAQTGLASALAVQMVNTSYNNKAEQASYKLIVDGVNKTSEVTFKVQNNRSMIGLRQFSNALGATVDWDNKKVAIVKKGSTTIEVPIGSKEVIVNGNKKAIDNQGTVSIIVDSATFLPFRIVAESLGYTVSYDQNTKTITCTSSQTQQQPPQLQIENKYNVTVPQGMENTTWLQTYNFLRGKGLTNEQALQVVSNIKVAPAGDGSGTATLEQSSHFNKVTSDPAYRELKELPPASNGEFEYQYKMGWFWVHGQWGRNDRLYAGLIGTTIGL